MQMTSFPLQLNTSQKDTLDDLTEELKQVEWENGEYLFHDFIEYFQLPQIVHVSQPWETNFVKNDVLLLQTVQDRHLITAKSLAADQRTFIIPDWFQGQCRILTANPVYKPRWWDFHNSMELLRFEMPRAHVRLLQATAALLLLPTNQTIPVLLKENTEVTLKRIEKSSTITNGKEMFVFGDQNDQEFLYDPTHEPEKFHFATKILESEFDQSYHKDTAENLFLLPEVIIRYELPIEVEFASLPNAVPIENFPLKLRLEKFCIAKSVIAFSISDALHPRILEFSSLVQFSLHCVKCLTVGLPRDASVHEGTRTFDESAYGKYEQIRERLVQLFEDASLQYLRTPFVGNYEEVDAIGKVHDIGFELKNEENLQTYTLLDQTNTSAQVNEPNQAALSISKHPARFTVHLPADFNSPYSNTMEINDGDEE